jgi:hypothetical protein
VGVASVILALALACQTPPTAEERLARGKALLADLEYEQAATELMLAADDESAPEALRLDAHLHAGMAYVVLERRTEARLSFLYVLRRDPDAALPPDTPPKISSFFQLCRDEVLAMQTAAPAAPASASAQPEAEAGAAWLPLALVGAGAGGVALGAGFVAIGALPWLQHQAAAAELAQLQAGAIIDGAEEAQDRQRAAAESWTSWGAASSVVGWAGVTLGVTAAVVGLVWWSVSE